MAEVHRNEQSQLGLAAPRYRIPAPAQSRLSSYHLYPSCLSPRMVPWTPHLPQGK